MTSNWLSVQLQYDKIQDYEIIFAEYTGALSQPECIKVKILSSQSHAEMLVVLNQVVGIVMQDVSQSWVFTLKLFKIHYLLAEELMGRNCYMLELYSPLYDLMRFKMTPLLKNVSIAQMADLLLNGRLSGQQRIGLQPYRFALDVTDIDQPVPMLKGLHESAYHFLSRILGYYGLSYYFDHAEQGIMVISDHIAKFANIIEPLQNKYAAGELLTVPYYEIIRRDQYAAAENIIAGGHPHHDPGVLIMGTANARQNLSRQITATEFDAKAAKKHSLWTLEAIRGEANRNDYGGGGILFPGLIDQTEAVLFTKTAYALEFDGHEAERIRAIPMQAVGQRLAFPYRDMPNLQEHTQLLQGTSINDITGATGHYHALLPDYITDPQPGLPILNTRVVYPMQSDDHKEHFTLMNDAEGLLFYNAGTLGESLLFGTANSMAAGHLTQQNTAQNAYWQDASHSKTAFINEGIFDRSQQTGRHTAFIMEAPNYHPDGSNSYLRMGDSIQNDAGYSAQSAENGIFMVSTGHYQEEHQGGLLHLSGNTGDNAIEPVPVYREMTQLDPVGTPHILQTSTANLHSDLKTSNTVTHSTELTQGTLTEALTAPDVFNTWSADNTRQIWVNQNRQQTGHTTDITVNTQNTSLTATQYNLTQNGTLRTDQLKNQIITQNHKQNLENYQHLQKNVNQGQEQISTQNLDIQNYSRTIQTGVIQAEQSKISAGYLNANANTMQIGSIMMQGAASSLQQINIKQAQVARNMRLQQQNADLKEEIVFRIDDPDNIIQAMPKLSVNQKNQMLLKRNGVTIYPLTKDQKQGSVTLNFTNIENNSITLHSQVRLLNIQNSSLQMQNYKPYFTPQKKMPSYIGVQKVPGLEGLDLDDEDINVVMLASATAPPGKIKESYNVNLVSDDMITWVMQAIYNVNKLLPRYTSGDSEGQRWDWEIPSMSDFGLLFKDGVNALAVKDNRRFIMEFFHNGNFVIKEIKGQWMIVFKGQAGLRNWVTGTAYSLENKNKIRIFKSYARMMTDEGKLTRLAVTAEDAATDSALVLVVIVPLDILQYFLLDKNPNKQISDIFVNIGIDLVNNAVAGVLITALLVLLGLPSVGAGFLVLLGIAVTAVAGWSIKQVEDRMGITNVLIKFGRKAENHFIAQGDILKIDFEAFSSESTAALITTLRNPVISTVN